MLNRISKETETKLVEAVKDIALLTNQGRNPNDALLETVKQADFTADQIRLIAQSYNTARTNLQRKSSSDLFDKAAEFPLADAQYVIDILYPSKVKSASLISKQTSISNEYNSSPSWLTDLERTKKANYGLKLEKSANAYPVEKKSFVKQSLNLINDSKKQYEEFRRHISCTYDKVASSLKDIDNYFKTFGHIPFNEISNAVSLAYGKPGMILMNHVAKANKNLQKEANTKRIPVFDKSIEPFDLIDKCLINITTHNQLKEAFDKFNKQAGKLVSNLIEFINPTKEKETSILSKFVKIEKEAGLLGDVLGSALGTAVGTSFGGNKIQQQFGKSQVLEGVGNKLSPFDSRTDPELKLETFSRISDPIHETRLRNIQQQALFHDLMANDEVISGHSPEDVAKVFNEINALAPRASQQPMLMRALIRRHLEQGRVDTHDVDQLAGLENKLKERDQPMEELKMTDTKKLLGISEKKEDTKSASVLSRIKTRSL